MNNLFGVFLIVLSCFLGPLQGSANQIVVWGNKSPGGNHVPPSARNVVAIASGIEHSLALRNDGQVVIWGDDAYGQTNLPAGLSNVIAIAAGNLHSLALKSDGTVAA